MQEYQKEFSRLLADTGALFFAQGLRLKDGRPTPYFVNLGLFRTGRLISLLGAYFAEMIVDKGLAGQVDVLIGPSYKGSALAVAAAQALWANHGIDILYDYDRKEAKEHGEATGRGSLFVTNALSDHARLLIIDDVVTTMATKYDLLDTLKAESKARNMELTVAGVGLAVDRQQTTAVCDEKGRVVEGVKGDDAVKTFVSRTRIPVHCLVGIRDAVQYLAEDEVPVMINGIKRPLDAHTLKNFSKYLDTYGV